MRARRASGRSLLGVLALCAIAVAVLLVWRPWSGGQHGRGRHGPVVLTAPIPGGDSAANIPLDGAEKRVLVRWVARRSGTLVALHLRIQGDGSTCRQSGKTGYGGGNGGSWRATTHSVLADGRPDLGRTVATTEFRPCQPPAGVVDVRQGIVRLPMRVAVKRGDEGATVVANGDPDPVHNFTSANFLFTHTGLLGANGRNERSPDAPDVYYGLDPRELVGYSTDGGRTWSLPGGPYGARGGSSFLPTYLQEYSDGRITGQPYYYTGDPTFAPRTMVFQTNQRWTIRALGAYSLRDGSGTVRLTVGGVRYPAVRLSGAGMLRARISPVTVSPGQTVTVTATGLPLQNVVADDAWGRLAGLNRPTTPWRLAGQPNFSQAAPVYPLPAPPRQ